MFKTSSLHLATFIFISWCEFWSISGVVPYCVPWANNCWDGDKAGTSWLEQKGATEHNQYQQKKKNVRKHYEILALIFCSVPLFFIFVTVEYWVCQRSREEWSYVYWYLRRFILLKQIREILNYNRIVKGSIYLRTRLEIKLN